MKPAAPVLAMLALGMTPATPLQNAATPTTATHESSARPDVERLIAQSGGDVSVAFRSLDSGQELMIQADRPFQDSLALKIPVMIELFAQAAAQQVKLSDAVMVRNLFRSVVDSSAYTIEQSAGDSLEDAPERVMTLGQLCNAMIKTNSDIAANLLIEHLTLEAIQDRIHRLGADGMVLAAGFGDTKAADRGMKNVATPRALMTILLALAQNQVVSADASAQMVGLLANSRLPGSIVAIAVSPEVVENQKPSPGGDQHNAAIILGARSFVLVTDVRGISPGASAALVARISHALAAAI